jgi:aspartate/methionine/tyrosine aminotransferase
MHLKPFLLDEWLDTWEPRARFNLAASTGPAWSLIEILSLASDEERERFLKHKLVYTRPAGNERLRGVVAQLHEVDPEEVQIVTGASEALLILFWLAAEPGANVIVPRPGFTTFSALPESLRLETRFYSIRKEDDFRIDIEEIKRLADRNTRLILINSPHNPTGATISNEDLDALDEFTSSRGIQLVSDEVYHPIFHAHPTRSAARLPKVTVIHDFSKAFPLSGIRTGWMIERDAGRRKDYWTARSYFSITNNSAGEYLAELAVRHNDLLLGKTQLVASKNLRELAGFLSEHQETIAWIPPRGGMTAFPWLVSGENSRAFCRAAAEQGIVLAPGDCFDAPEHFRLGFGAMAEGFPEALKRLGEFVRSWSSSNVVRA